MRIRAILASLVFCLSVTAQAELRDRGGGLVYDDVLDITWLKDANASGMGMDWYESIAWADTLVYGGYDDWRLASMDVDMDGSNPVNCRTATEIECRDNELGYMFYYNLMGSAGNDRSGDQGPFTNISRYVWSETEFVVGFAWRFWFPGGLQTWGNKDDAGPYYGAWAVRSGGGPGTLDAGFGSGGKVITDFSGTTGRESAYGVIVQADGKIVVAGTPDSSGPFGLDFALARYHTDGSLDTSFGNGGKAATDIGGSDYLYAIALQADGKIVAAGTTYIGGLADFAVARYNSDGTLDSGFGNGGIVITDMGGVEDEGFDVAIQTDGKIIVVGRKLSGANIVLARYNPNGFLDTSFDGDGKIETDFGGFEDAKAIDIQANGKIVVGFNAELAFGLTRYNSDGSLDLSFGDMGKVLTDIGGYQRVNDIAIQADGKVVATGYYEPTPSSDDDVALARYNSDGSLDASFGSGGIVITDFDGNSEIINGITLQADGKIVVSGGTYPEGSIPLGDFLLLRYDEDGSLDTAFGDEGRTITDFGGYDSSYGIALQLDGRIVAAGTGAAPISSGEFVLARFEGDGIQVETKGDLNGDGRSDVVWRNTNSGQNWLYIMNGTTIATNGPINTVGTDWDIVGNGDYNGDGRADFLWRNAITGQNWMYLMNGATIVTSAAVNTVPAPWTVVGSGDLNGDGRSDILWRNTATGQNWLYQMNGNAITTSVGINTVTGPWNVVGNGDMNGDGKADILWRNTTSGQNFLYLMNGNAITSALNINTVTGPWDVVGNGDMNGDGKADILWRNTTTGQNWLYEMNGNAITTSASINTVTGPWSVVGNGDYNGDNKTDILWRNTTTGQNYMYLMNGNTITSSSLVNTVPTDWQVINTH